MFPRAGPRTVLPRYPWSQRSPRPFAPSLPAIRFGVAVTRGRHSSGRAAHVEAKWKRRGPWRDLDHTRPPRHFRS